MYLYQSQTEFAARIGSAGHEVADPAWVSIDDIMRSPVGTDRWRPGFRETLIAYHERIASNGNFAPTVFNTTADGPAVLTRLRQPKVEIANLYQPRQRLVLP